MCSRQGNEASSNSFALLHLVIVLAGPKSLLTAQRLSVHLANPSHPSPSDLKSLDPFKHLPTSLEDCTEESERDMDSDRVMFLAKVGRLGSPHCMFQCSRGKFNR